MYPRDMQCHFAFIIILYLHKSLYYYHHCFSHTSPNSWRHSAFVVLQTTFWGTHSDISSSNMHLKWYLNFAIIRSHKTSRSIWDWHFKTPVFLQFYEVGWLCNSIHLRQFVWLRFSSLILVVISLSFLSAFRRFWPVVALLCLAISLFALEKA